MRLNPGLVYKIMNNQSSIFSRFSTCVFPVQKMLANMLGMNFSKTLFFALVFQLLGAQFAMAQLSSRHYLPPLKRSNGFQTVDGQAIYLSTPEANTFEVKVYQGTNTTAIATLSISNSSPAIYTPAVATG
jgi:hypothetical protein